MIKIVQKEGEEVPTEVLAKEIQAISAGIKKLRSGKLNDRALVLLIHDAAPSFGARYKTERVGKREIEAVLAGLEDLAKTHLKRPAGKQENKTA